MPPALFAVALIPVERTPLLLRVPLVAMLPELEMTASEPMERTPCASSPAVEIVPELVMEALLPSERIPRLSPPEVIIDPGFMMLTRAPLENIALLSSPVVVIDPELFMLVSVPPEKIALLKFELILTQPEFIMLSLGAVELIAPTHWAFAGMLRLPMRAAGESSRTRPGHNRCGLDACSTMPRHARKMLSRRFGTARTRPLERVLRGTPSFGIHGPFAAGAAERFRHAEILLRS